MSLTQIHDVFASVHEDGLNDLIEAFYKSRTRYFIYGSPDFAPSTTATITSIPAISFPGIPGGIQFAVAFRQPVVDLHPDSSGGSAVLPPQAGQFSISANVILVVICGGGKRDIDPTHGKPTGPGTVPKVEHTELEIHARGSITSDGISIGFKVEEIEIVDICPESLESVIECIMRMILNAALQNIRIPIPSLSLDAFSLTLTQGPTIERDQVKVWGVI
jgi:hypothetical protein